MKNLISGLMAGAIALSIFVGCGNTETTNKNETEAGSNEKTVSVVTTIFPEYDWVKEIVGDDSNVEVTLLLDNGVDLHSYQPTADDIMKISTCDVFVYVGGESDEWVEDALGEATNKNMQVINLLDVLGENVKEEEIVEGMEAEEEEENHEEEDEEVELDEHVWLSLKNSQILVSNIAQVLSEVDSANKDRYKKNADSYNSKLAELDNEYKEVINAATNKNVLFGDRFPFRYLVDDYNLNYYAAFVGCSAETEASFETIKFLSDKVDELGLSAVMVIENSDKKIAQTIIENTNSKNAKILTMDSMQSTTYQDVEDGASYLTIMEQNLKVLEEGLK